MSSQYTLNHLAIIMDGNRRWATERGMPKFLGHTEGAKNLRTIAKATNKAGIPFLTLYTLSTENLKNRSPEELDHLFSLIGKLAEYASDFEKENTKFFVIGDLSKIPQKPRESLMNLIEKTKHHTAMTLTLAINYGGRDEIIRATQKMIVAGISPNEITEELFETFLDTHKMPDVDLVVRTGGDKRLSGYLPWQSTYAELYFTPTFWPAFSETNLKEAIDWFFTQKRNKGK